MYNNFSVVVGNILSVKKGIIIHGCNARGVMGSGVAWDIRTLYPGAFDVYYNKKKETGLIVGEVVWYRHRETDLYIANAITQENYGRGFKNICYVDYNSISKVFKEVTQKALELNLPVHFPKIGAYRGGGNWDIIFSLIKTQMHPSVEYVLWHYNETK